MAIIWLHPSATRDLYIMHTCVYMLRSHHLLLYIGNYYVSGNIWEAPWPPKFSQIFTLFPKISQIFPFFPISLIVHNFLLSPISQFAQFSQIFPISFFCPFVTNKCRSSALKLTDFLELRYSVMSLTV